MKRISRTTVFFLILLTLVFSQSLFAADRSPFDEPINARDMYDYGKALEKCRIIGIITTEKNGKVILKLTNSDAADLSETATETPSVYSVDDRILIESNGILHKFTLSKIKSKSIVLKGGNGKTYEVEAR